MVVPVIAAAVVVGGLNAVGSYANTLSQASDLKRQASLKRKEAQGLFEDAANIATANSVNEDLQRRSMRLELSQFRAQTKMSGLSGGTLIDLDMQTQENMEADILMERYNGHVQYIQKKKEAQYALDTAAYMKRQAHKMKSTGWVSALLGGASSGVSTAAAGGAFNGAGGQK